MTKVLSHCQIWIFFFFVLKTKKDKEEENICFLSSRYQIEPKQRQTLFVHHIVLFIATMSLSLWQLKCIASGVTCQVIFMHRTKWLVSHKGLYNLNCRRRLDSDKELPPQKKKTLTGKMGRKLSKSNRGGISLLVWVQMSITHQNLCVFWDLKPEPSYYYRLSLPFATQSCIWIHYLDSDDICSQAFALTSGIN